VNAASKRAAQAPPRNGETPAWRGFVPSGASRAALQTAWRSRQHDRFGVRHRDAECGGWSAQKMPVGSWSISSSRLWTLRGGARLVAASVRCGRASRASRAALGRVAESGRPGARSSPSTSSCQGARRSITVTAFCRTWASTRTWSRDSGVRAARSSGIAARSRSGNHGTESRVRRLRRVEVIAQRLGG